MASKQDWTASARASRWAAIGAYLRPLRRRSAARRRLSARPRRDPDRPRPLLSTLPYLALTFALALITMAIVSLAMPGQYRERVRSEQVRAGPPEPGTAPPGWIDG